MTELAASAQSFWRAMSHTKTLDSAFASPTSGFDYLRLSLSVAVIGWHTIVASYGAAYELPIISGPWRGIVWSILPSFFALSGFLVSGSLMRSQSLVVFGSLRALRIFPALTVDVLFWALIMGPLITDFTLSDYFTDRKFYSYLTNILGWIHYQLPGVFQTNPHPFAVNVQLWTIPYELECYIVLGLTAALGLTRRRVMIFIPIAALIALHVIGVLNGSAEAGPAGFPPGRFLVLSFLIGVAFYFYRNSIPLNFAIFLVSCGASYALLQSEQFFYAAALPVTYATTYVGVLTFKKLPLIFSGDYSYGLYLYGFPMQQLTSWLFPDYRHWWLNLIISLFLSGIMAAVSWHLIEKPILDRKRLLIERFQGAISAFTTYIKRFTSTRSQA